MLDVWSRSSFRVTGCWLPQCWCRQNNWSCTEISPFTDCNKTHFCCKFVIHSLDMKPFYWFQWYKWLKMDCKMSLVFLTASFDITEDFHILHSAYKVTYTFVIPSLKQKLTTVSLTHTHTNPSTTTHKKQLGMSHLLLMVISLAQKLLLCAKFRPLWVKKLDWLWGRLQVCSNEGMFQAFTLVWQTAQNRCLHKTGGTYYQNCMYPTDTAWLAFLMPFLLLLPASGYLSCGFTAPSTKHAYSALHPQALTECSPLDFRRSSVMNRCDCYLQL